MDHKLAYGPYFTEVTLSCADEMAQDLLHQYARRMREVDADFSARLEAELMREGYDPSSVPDDLPLQDVKGIGLGQMRLLSLSEIGVFTVGQIAATPDCRLLMLSNFGKETIKRLRVLVPFRPV